MDVPIRKAQAGSDSLGHTWSEDGAVVLVSPEDAQDLLAIKDGGFSVDDDHWDKPEAVEAEVPEVVKSEEFSEVDPKAEATEPVADDAESLDAPAKPAAKKTAARKTAASKPE